MQQLRERLNRDHEVSGFLQRIQDQSQRLQDIYSDEDGSRQKETQQIGTGEPFQEFYRELGEIKSFHRRYPNEPVENLERAYRKVPRGEADAGASEVDRMFSGEEVYGRYLDLVRLHEMYLNLKGVRGGRRLNYLQYLEHFDTFTPPQCPVKREDKLHDEYFQYVDTLASYLEGFMRRTRPLEDLDGIFGKMEKEFAAYWEAGKVSGWQDIQHAKPDEAAPVTEGSGEGLWCADCEKEFKNDNVYKSHLTGKKHLRAVELRKGQPTTNGTNGTSSTSQTKPKGAAHLKERAVAEREYRTRKLASMMQTERHDTRVNVERRAGMTERERQMEREAMFAESEAAYGGQDEDSGDDDEDRIHNPLKLPISWDGRPIPYWLYKLHGLGVEYPCEICGGFVHAGRRAFEKHFGEPRHTYGLKCLGITNGALFREITSIDEATKLQAKLDQDKKDEKLRGKDVEEMEDGEGNVMPRKIYEDLQKQGLI